MNVDNDIVKIDSWKRKSTTKPYIYPDGEHMVLNLKKFLPKSASKLIKENPDAISHLNTFIIKRKLFYNKIDVLCHYIDYYIEFFDPEKELPLTYLYIKNQIDTHGGYLDADDFVDMVVTKFFRDMHTKRNVMALVEHNYFIDITVDKKTGRVFNEPYDFTNEDGKILYGISMVMKFVIPLISQYVDTNLAYDSDTINQCTMDLFMEIFFRMGSYGSNDPDSLLKKLYKFISDKTVRHSSDNRILWSQQEALRGLTETLHIDIIIVRHLLSNNMFKFVFNDNIVSFLKSIVETQLLYTINKVKYKADPIRVDSTKDTSGLSSVDKLEQSLAKKNESEIIRSEKSTNDIIDHLIHEYGDISEDEFNYYTEHFITNSEYQFMLLGYAYAKYFGGYMELKNMGNIRHIKLLIICKRMLKSKGFKQLPWLISSVTRGRTTTRLMQNNKFLNKYKSSPTYKHITDETYVLLKGFNNNQDIPLSIISMALNNVYTYVEYENQDLTGEIIEFDEDVIADELLTFFDSI